MAGFSEKSAKASSSNTQSEQGTQKAEQKTAGGKRGWTTGNFLLLLTLAVALTLAWRNRSLIAPTAIAAREQELVRYVGEHRFQAIAVSMLGYAAVTGLSLPGAAVLSLILGKLLGFGSGVVTVSFGSTLGASIAFLISRYLLRDWARSLLGARFQAIDKAIDREGAMYLFSLRLQPIAPFWLVNLAMGLTRISLANFWWVSQLGMLPGTVAFVYAGSSLPNLSLIAEGKTSQIVSWKLLLALAILGLLPWVVKALLPRIQKVVSQPSRQVEKET